MYKSTSFSGQRDKPIYDELGAGDLVEVQRPPGEDPGHGSGGGQSPEPRAEPGAGERPGHVDGAVAIR